ncbi:MAG: uroporphyrinogen decarboxylase family protein [Bacteroidales bacterium]|jgi:uroporphyrinogen-III decarboxylase|nr:uroporphyrinogen decarboxylase family protein [Bacteroidales bacterium]
MTGYERTLRFLNGESTDHPPFHPIIMRWAAKHAGVKYGRFCTDPNAKSYAMLKCARDFDLDWVTVMSDPWAEASAYGIEVEYPEDDLPVDKGGHFQDAESVTRARKFNAFEERRCAGRIAELKEFRSQAGNELFIVGWVEGPVAEYVDLRGAAGASLDFLLEADKVSRALDVIVANALDFISHQVDAGADCIGIGDAFSSQIGPDLYYQYAFEREKTMVSHIHSLGAKAKLHICGNTEAIIPGMIKTGADIIDIDHLVPSLEKFAGLLGPYQVFSGKCDPVSIVQSGPEESIRNAVISDYKASSGRCIISAGCEITPGTPAENMIYFRDSRLFL